MRVHNLATPRTHVGPLECPKVFVTFSGTTNLICIKPHNLTIDNIKFCYLRVSKRLHSDDGFKVFLKHAHHALVGLRGS